MMKLRRCLYLFVVIIASSCGGADEDGPGFSVTSVNDDFSQSLNTWQYGFADYPVWDKDSSFNGSSFNDSSFYELKYGYTTVPGLGNKSIMLSGNNLDDDLFMYIKRKVANLDPNTQYTLTFDVEFASNAKTGEQGGPGDNVFLKVGASNVEPKTVAEGSEHTLNIDKGSQGVNGGNMVVIGNISVPASSSGYVLQTRTNSPYNNDTYNFPVVATTNIDGELWFIVGTDSGYKGITTLYYTKVSVVLSKVK